MRTKAITIAAKLHAQIKSGDLKPWQPVPTRSALARELGVANVTVATAYSILERQGLLYREFANSRTFYVTGTLEPRTPTEEAAHAVGELRFALAQMDQAVAEQRNLVNQRLAAVESALGRIKETPDPAMAEINSALPLGSLFSDHGREVQELRQRILKGELAYGERLPNVRELAERWKCSASTANRLLQPLIEAGLLATRRGGGTFVTYCAPQN